MPFKKISTNVCVIGSGVAGGTVAKELLDAGVKDVLMLEAGGKIPMRDSRLWHDYQMARRFDPYEPADYKASDYENVGADIFKMYHLRVRGGTTLHWQGECFRLKPEDFRLQSSVGKGIDWPISYEDLEPFYAVAEHTLQLSGDAKDPGHPPRSGPFPMPPFSPQETDGPFIEAMGELGYPVQHVGLARNKHPIHGLPACQTTGTCRYCPIGAKFSGDQLLDRLEEKNGFKLLLNSSVTRIHLHSKNKASHIEVARRIGENIETWQVEANHFVICGGTIESSKLLLNSANSDWNEGLGNSSGALGRYLMNHYAIYGHGDRPNPEGLSKQLDFRTTATRYFDSEQYQPDGKFITCPSSFMWPAWTAYELAAKGESKETILKSLKGTLDLPLFCWGEDFPDPEHRVSLGKKKDSLGLPSTVIQYSMKMKMPKKIPGLFEKIFKAMNCSNVKWEPLSNMAHTIGTCRMSKFDSIGVVDENLRVHGLENVYVSSAAVFPNSGAASPTLTIAALSHRLGKHLANKLRPR